MYIHCVMAILGGVRSIDCLVMPLTEKISQIIDFEMPPPLLEELCTRWMIHVFSYLFVFICCFMFCALATKLLCNFMVPVVFFCICMLVNVYMNKKNSGIFENAELYPWLIAALLMPFFNMNVNY